MRTLTGLATAMLIAGCNGLSEQDEASQPDHLQYSYVVVGANGAAIARAIGTHGTCPLIHIGTTSVRMQLRADSGTMAQRAAA